MSEKTTVIIPKESLHQALASCALNFLYEKMPIHLDCRILEYQISKRTHPENYDHPSPPLSRIFLFKEGHAEVICKGKKQKLVPGRIYLLPTGLPFEITYGISVMPYLHIFVSDISGRSVFENQPEILAIKDSDLFESIFQSIKKNETFRLFPVLMEVIRNFLVPLMPELKEKSLNSQKFSLLFNWLRDRKPATITVDDAAELYGISSSAFSKRFHRTMEISFKEYLNSQQIQKAQQLLFYTDKNITQIAAELGHSSPQYFHRFFKKQCQFTPDQYRRKIRDSQK